MEHRRRTVSSVLDEDIENPPSSRPSSPSIDEQIDEYTEFIYNGSYNISKSVFKGFINLICPCCYRKRDPIQVN
jgi:hypothetical protein